MYFQAVTPTLPQVSQESEHLMSAVPLVPLVPFFCVLCCELGRGLFIALLRHFPDCFLLYYPTHHALLFLSIPFCFPITIDPYIPTYKCAARGGLQHGERTEQAAFAMPGKVASPSLQTSGIKTVGVQYNDTGGAGSGSGSGNSSANSKDACSSSSSSSSESGGIRGFFSSLFGFSSSPSTGNISSSSNNSSSSNSSSLQSSNTAPVMRATATTTASYSKNTQTKQ